MVLDYEMKFIVRDTTLATRQLNEWQQTARHPSPYGPGVDI
jgi:hypothetical protein